MKINIFKIIFDHFETIRDDRYKEHKIDWISVGIMYVLPILLVLVLYLTCFNQHKEVIDVITISLSIFIGLLFNLLVLIHGLFKEKKEYVNEKQKIKEGLKANLTKELYKNISYLILIAILSIVIYAFSFTMKSPIKEIFYYAIYFLFLNFILTLLMVLKRKYIILLDEFDES